MRINNKYNRNRAYRVKHWKRIRNTKHPYRTYCPYSYFGLDVGYDAETQTRRNFEHIATAARLLESGTHKAFNASSWFRRQRTNKLRAEQRVALNRVRHGDHDTLFPPYKKDAEYLWW